MKLLAVVLCATLLIVLAKASPYNKYGRTCRDILCIAGQEECVMEQDACTTSTRECGNYPTCKRKAGATKRGCASLKCEAGHFCSIRQENCVRPPCEIKPVCIAFRTSATATSSTSVLSKPNTNSYSGGSYYGQRTGSAGSQYGGGQSTGSSGSQYGGSGQRTGSSGSQYGGSGQRTGSSGSQYGGSGQRTGSSGSQYGSGGQYGNTGTNTRTSWSWSSG